MPQRFAHLRFIRELCCPCEFVCACEFVCVVPQLPDKAQGGDRVTAGGQQLAVNALLQTNSRILVFCLMNRWETLSTWISPLRFPGDWQIHIAEPTLCQVPPLGECPGLLAENNIDVYTIAATGKFGSVPYFWPSQPAKPVQQAIPASQAVLCSALGNITFRSTQNLIRSVPFQ